MTVSTEAPPLDYPGTGSTGPFSVTWPIYAKGDLLVCKQDAVGIETTLVVDTDYTVTGVGDSNGGSVTLTAALEVDEHLTIAPDPELIQNLNLRAQGRYPAESIERALDLAVQRSQRLNAMAQRCVRLRATDLDGRSAELPLPIANRVLAWNDDATALVGVDPSDLGGGAGGSGVSDALDVTAAPFEAYGDGVSRLLTTDQAAAFNSEFGSYGLAVDTTWQWDAAAIQAALYTAANTGRRIYIPAGTYIVNKSLGLSWTTTPISGQPARPICTVIYGDGESTVIKSTIATSGRAALEFLGETNDGCNISISNLNIRMDGGSVGSYCLRIGDSWCGMHLHRVRCYGPNGLLLKVASSSSYATFCAKVEQCLFWTNYNNEWWADDVDALGYAVSNETGGSGWDNVLFDSCAFRGVCYPRAFVLTFLNCQFWVNPDRGTDGAGVPHNRNIFHSFGGLSCLGCYFEDHNIAIDCAPYIADIRNVEIRNCQFTGTNNFPSGTTDRAISITIGPNGDVGPVNISCNKFGQGYALEAVLLIGVTGSFTDNYAITQTTSPNNKPEVTTDFQFCHMHETHRSVNGGGTITSRSVSTFPSDDFVKVTASSSDTDALSAPDGGVLTLAATATFSTIDPQGSEATAAATWFQAIKNQAGTDNWLRGWSSSLYTTGGAIGWLPNSTAFEYFPSGTVLRTGWGLTSTDYDATGRDLKDLFGCVSQNRGQDFALVQNSPHWVYFDVLYSAFTAIAATTGTVQFRTLPAGCFVHASKVKHGAAFTGGAIATCTIQVGITGTLAKFAAAFDIFQAPGNLVQQAQAVNTAENHAATVDVQVSLTTTGANLTALTAGACRVWLLVSKAT